MDVFGALKKFNWKETVGAIAPGIATALGGPLAGMATKAVCEALGLPEGASESDIAMAVKGMTPEQALKLKKGDQDFAIRMRELDIDVYSLDQKDRDSARTYAMKQGAIMVNLLSLLILIAFVVCVYLVLFSELKVESALAGTLIGYLSAKAEQVVAFHFGSSSGSKSKANAMLLTGAGGAGNVSK